MLCPLLDTGPAPCEPTPYARCCSVAALSSHPFCVLTELTALCQPTQPRGKGGVAADVCTKVSCRCRERRRKRRFVCLEGADVQGRTSGALLTPEVMQLLTSLRSRSEWRGPVLGKGG